MTTDISTAKVITQHGPRDFDASFDGNYIGSFRSHPEAQQALNDHVMDLIEHGLIDTPLAALDAQPCIHCGTVQERASCDDCVAWPEAEPIFNRSLIPSADWGAYATGDIETCACGLPAVVLLHGAHDMMDIALCYRCHGAYCAMDWPEPIPALNEAQALDPETPDPSPPPWDAPAIVRKTIVAWQCNRAACAQWLALFNDAEQRMLAQAVIAYRRQFYPTDLTVDRLVSEWKGGAH